tara:strand:- start:934 stop:1410 length:477 start_codon:yes stop_codon:yes gene_type:complete
MSGQWYSIHDLSKHIFKNNDEGHDMLLGLEESVKTNKELFSFCFQLFCNGLVLLYGDGQKLLLNALSMEQLDTIRAKLKCVHIHVKIATYDLDTAYLLDMVEKPNSSHNQQQPRLNEGSVLAKSMAAIRTQGENDALEDYALTLMMHGNVMQIHFEIN